MGLLHGLYQYWSASIILKNRKKKYLTFPHGHMFYTWYFMHSLVKNKAINQGLVINYFSNLRCKCFLNLTFYKLIWDPMILACVKSCEKKFWL